MACLDFGRTIHDREFERLEIAEIEHTVSFRPLDAPPTTLDDVQLAFTKARLLDGYLKAGLEGFDGISKGPAYRSFDLSCRIIHVKSWHVHLKQTSAGSATASGDSQALDNNAKPESTNVLLDHVTTLVR